jgi:hypothetical protein
MAGRQLCQFAYSHEKYKIDLEIIFDGNTTSNPILKQWNPGTNAYVTNTVGYRGVKSITRTGVGVYRINLQDRYQRILGYSYGQYIIDETNAPATSDCYIKAQAVNTSSTTAPSFTIVTYGTTMATPVELDANTRVFLNVSLSNSSAL